MIEILAIIILIPIAIVALQLFWIPLLKAIWKALLKIPAIVYFFAFWGEVFYILVKSGEGK